MRKSELVEYALKRGVHPSVFRLSSRRIAAETLQTVKDKRNFIVIADPGYLNNPHYEEANQAVLEVEFDLEDLLK